MMTVEQKPYEAPEAVITVFRTDDVMTLSSPAPDGGEWDVLSNPPIERIF